MQHYPRPDRFSGRALAFTVTGLVDSAVLSKQVGLQLLFPFHFVHFVHAKNGGTYFTCAKNVV